MSIDFLKQAVNVLLRVEMVFGYKSLPIAGMNVSVPGNTTGLIRTTNSSPAGGDCSALADNDALFVKFWIN